MQRPTGLRFIADFISDPRIHCERREWLTPQSRIFTMGSCFAISVRRTLEEAGLKVYPDFSKIKTDPQTQMFNMAKPTEVQTMPPYYDTYVMRQEIEAAFGLWPDRSKGFIETRDSKANTLLKSDVVFQDPYRKATFATTREHLQAVSDDVTAAMAEGIRVSDIMVFTLGVSEVWRHKDTGKCVLQSPFAGYGTDKSKVEFYQSTFNDNYENVRAMLSQILARYPDKKIIISVSPVRLKMTFSQTDVGTANVESKAILRAVAGQICREYGDNVMYFPSYEIAMLGLGTLTGIGHVFKENGIEIRDEFVSMVTQAFMTKISPRAASEAAPKVA